MKLLLKILLFIVLVILGGSALWFSFLDGHFDSSRSIVIKTTPEAVYSEISDVKTWPNWLVWFERDSTMEAHFNDKTQGLGAKYSWTSESSGGGNMEIIEANPNMNMKTKINFDGMGSSNGYWEIEPTDEGTKVTWGLKGELPFFFRWMAQDMDKKLGPDFDAGLANLKKELESRKTPLEISVVNYKSTQTYFVQKQVDWSALKDNSSIYQQSFGEIVAFLGDEKDKISGMPLTITHEWDEVNQTALIDFAIPCNAELKPTGDIKKGETLGGKMLKANHYGKYEDLDKTHYAIDDYMLTNNIEMDGPVMEVYVTDPTTEPDTTSWLTEVYYRIK